MYIYIYISILPTLSLYFNPANQVATISPSHPMSPDLHLRELLIRLLNVSPWNAWPGLSGKRCAVFLGVAGMVLGMTYHEKSKGFFSSILGFAEGRDMQSSIGAAISPKPGAHDGGDSIDSIPRNISWSQRPG